ncbi:hypothetical protein LBMAG51_01100 [Phycisphaerae bacterium]|nr:hypothetical protein LBMAG51_01100 [Phycisphaerae bacterium]
MRTNHILLPVTLVLGALLFAAGLPTTPTVVASVDLEKVYRSLDQLKAAEARSVTLRGELEKRLAAMTDSVKSMQEDLDSFQVGTPAHNDAMNKVILKAGDLSALQSYAKLKMESEQANSVRETYISIRSACGLLAKEQKVDFVFIDDTVPGINPTNLEGTMQQISGRRMLYSNSALDMTDSLIERMNTDFRAANPSLVPPVATPAATPAAVSKPAVSATQTTPTTVPAGKS